MKIRIWGCRGSLPTAPNAREVRGKVVQALAMAGGRTFESPAAIEQFVDAELEFPLRGTYGGESSCVEIDGGGEEFVVCDMGSGLREFGLDSIRRTGSEGDGRVYNIFLSHLHWDHIMGFPFFTPAFNPANTIRFHGGHESIEAVLRRQQEDPCFPVPLDWMQAKFEFNRVRPGESYEIAGFRVSVVEQHHHGLSYGYRFEEAGRSVVYSTDSEHNLEQMDQEQRFVDFFANADMVIFDTMYSLGDAITIKQDWGHSSNIVAVDLCQLAGVRRLCMFHHEPIHNDRMIHDVFLETVRYEELVRREGAEPLQVLCAYDGMEIEI